MLLLIASHLGLRRVYEAIAVYEEGAESRERVGQHEEADKLRRRAAELRTAPRAIALRSR